MIRTKYSNILVLGAQGSGKDTQAELLAPRIHGAVSIGMSNVFRHFLQHDPDFLGDEVERMAEGQLVTCGPTMECLRSYTLEQIPQEVAPWIFIGVPRTPKQALVFRDNLPEYRRLWDTVAIIFKLDPAIALERCLARAKKDEAKGRRRVDDTPVKIGNRLSDYFVHEGEVYNALEQSQITCIEVDARNSPEHIHDTVIDRIMQ